MSSIRRRNKLGVIHERRVSRGSLGERIEEWETVGTAGFSVYTLSGQKVVQLSAHYGETTHLLLTSRKGLSRSENRIQISDQLYLITNVIDDGRRAQVFARKLDSRG